MIETLPTPPPVSDLAVSVEALAGFAALPSQISARSQIVWAEHCSECAYPKCYEACAFYTPRADLHCRRFEAGIEPLPYTPGGARLHRIRFRRWGKLEGRGATSLTSTAQAEAHEKTDGRIAGAIAAIPAPFAVKRKLASQWNLAKQARPPGRGAVDPDAFVVECWSPEDHPSPFTLTVLNIGGASNRLFQARFEIGPDFQRLIVPIADMAAHVDLAEAFLIQIEPIGEAAGRDVVFGVCDFVKFARAVATAPAARPVKVVVWDLDETLWTGVLAEDGASGVRPRAEAVAAVKALDERGVLQSIASKNDPAEAMAALERFGLADFFLHPQIHWGPKSQSVADIAAALDLGVDSFVFVDDQAFERAEVAARHPGVRLLTHSDVAGILDHAWFNLPVTPESRQRRGLYRDEAARAAAFQATGEDYLRFLRDSAIRADVRRLNSADAERVFELSQRTNQLNFRGAKYSRDDVQAMLAPDAERLRISVRCADRFGDYGLIGFVCVDLAAGEITDLFMSCRVQRKRVEQALFAWIAAELAARRHTQIVVHHRPTERNGAARAMLADLGFAADVPAPEVHGAAQTWRRALDHPFQDADVVALCADNAMAMA
jgi:FkbH-like protein